MAPHICSQKIDCESFPPTSSLSPPDTRSATSESSCVGHLSFTFLGTHAPYVFLDVMCLSVMGSSIPSVMHLPGIIMTDPAVCEITSSNSKQDFIISPQLC